MTDTQCRTSRSMALRAGLVACFAMAFACQTVSAANTFYWKLDGSTWGDPNDSANWDVGSAGGGNPSSLVPSSADSIYTGSYLFDLNGGSLTAGTIKYVNWDSLRAVQVTNGTFTLATLMQTRSVHMDIWDGGKVVLPAGSSWIRFPISTLQEIHLPVSGMGSA